MALAHMLFLYIPSAKTSVVFMVVALSSCINHKMILSSSQMFLPFHSCVETLGILRKFRSNKCALVKPATWQLYFSHNIADIYFSFFHIS